MNIQRGVAILTLVSAFIFFFVLGMAYQKSKTGESQETVTPTPTVSQVACTMEAKICPDGSSVGRTGPNCEFARCPEELTSEEPQYECPVNNYVDCMPGPLEGINRECTPDFISWAEANCPDFEVAY